MAAPLDMLLQHGWGWDRGCWAAWQEAAPPAWRLSAAERGYFGGVAGYGPGAPVVVAHSFGLHLVDRAALAAAELVVGIGVFGRFHGGDGRSRRLLRRMRRRLPQQPEDLLREFYITCLGSAAVAAKIPGRPDVGLLAADLAQLDEEGLDVGALSEVGCVLLLHGSEDAVVPLEQAQHLQAALPNSRLQVCPGGVHALHMTRPEWCWAQIETAWSQV